MFLGVISLFATSIYSNVTIASDNTTSTNPVNIKTAKSPGISVVDFHTCHKLAGTNLPFMLIIHKGENLTDTIIKCADAINIKSAMLSGLGALENPTLAYYNLETKQYQNKTFSGIYELISLNGNISFAQDKRFFHIHVAIADTNYQVHGGHLVDSLVGVTAEVTFVPFNAPMFRIFDSDVGLKLISPE
jgi:predicted DNA-binding protein with PD1-like motif